MDTTFTKDTVFKSPTFGKLNLTEVVTKINEYLAEDDSYEYNIIVGTDSQRNGNTKFVTAIVVHRVGKGAIFFYRTIIEESRMAFQDRIYTETGLSIACANELIDLFIKTDALYSLAIHCDLGRKGKTKELISGIVGWVTSAGFECKIKPDAAVASCVADKFSK
jgi:hypothetical protein